MSDQDGVSGGHYDHSQDNDEISMIAFIFILFIRSLRDKQKKGFGIALMEVHIQEGSNSSIEQPDNFNDVGWASFPEINEKEPVRRVSHC